MIKKIATGIAAASIFLSSAMPALAVSNHGGCPGHHGKVVKKCLQKVHQSSVTNSWVNADVISNTGGNIIAGTTGGDDPTIDTGDATSTLTVDVSGGNNDADLPNCCCNGDMDTTLLGDDGHHKVKMVNAQKVHQSSVTNSWVNANVVSNTGGNAILGTTGDGSSEINTGDAESSVAVTVEGGHNTIL